MKSFIQLIISYEIYLRAISGVVIVGGICKQLYDRFIFKKYRKHSSNALFGGEESLTHIYDNVESAESVLGEQKDGGESTGGTTLQDIIERSKETVDMTQKLLQHIEVETEGTKKIINKIEAMEKENEKENDIGEYLSKDSQKIADNNNQNDSTYSSKGADHTTTKISHETSTEIYNITTNHESINKQKIAYETIKHEIDTLKIRNLRVDYEKKLIEATSNFPDESEFHITLGDWYIEREEYKKAQSLFKKLHIQDENNDKILYKLGIINLELQDFVSAEYLLTRAHNIKPDNPKYHQILAEIKYNLEKIDESIELMEKAVDLRPGKFEYIEILGRLYKEVNNIHLYYKTLLKLNALDPLNAKVKAELAKLKQ